MNWLVIPRVRHVGRRARPPLGSVAVLHRSAVGRQSTRLWFREGWRHADHRLLGLGIILMGAAALVSCDVLTGGALTHLDLRVHHWDIGAHWPDLRPLADAVVLAGQRGPVGAVVGLVVAGTARRLRSWRPLLHPASAVVTLNLVVGGLKLIIGRSGPYTGHDNFFVGGMDFPSGHASNALLMWGSLAVVLASSGLVRQRWALLAGVVAVTGAVSSACIVLDTHWVSDLVAGWLVGGALLAIISAIVRPVAPRPRRRPTIGATDGGQLSGPPDIGTAKGSSLLLRSARMHNEPG